MGRPRSAAADSSILDATLQLIASEGLTALSVEAVAARAGVGKSTIYRRWPNKEAMVGDALATINDELPVVPELGSGVSTRDLLVAYLEQIRCKSGETLSGRILTQLISHGDRHPELFKLFYEKVLDPRRERYRVVLRAAVASGELRPDLDVNLTATALAAPMIYLHMMATAMGPTQPGTSEAIVDLVLDGARCQRSSELAANRPVKPPVKRAGPRVRATGS